MGMTASTRSVASNSIPEGRGSLDLPPFFDLSDDLLAITCLTTGEWEKTNAAFLRHLGYTGAELAGTRASSLVHPDDLIFWEAAAGDLANGRPLTFRGRMRAKLGHYRLIAWTLTPRPDLGLVYCVGRPQSDFDTSNALEAAHAFAFSWSRASDELVLDPSVETVLGHPPSALPTGHSYLHLVNPTDFERLSSKIAVATRGSPAFEACYRVLRRDGQEIWIEEAGCVLFSAEGRKCGIRGVCRDVTQRKLSEGSAELVMNEMSHRAKNILTVVQAVLQFTKADTVEAYAAAIRHRVQALARVQGFLSTKRWQGIDLSEVIAAEFEPFGGLDGKRLTASGPLVRISSNALQPLTLVIHELATNAAKYGALSVPEGTISLTWSLDSSGLTLTWREAGGPETRPPTHKGFGHTLLAVSLKHIGGGSRINFDANGLICELHLPERALARMKDR